LDYSSWFQNNSTKHHQLPQEEDGNQLGVGILLIIEVEKKRDEVRKAGKAKGGFLPPNFADQDATKEEEQTVAAEYFHIWQCSRHISVRHCQKNSQDEAQRSTPTK
jgi:hypothetical protein